MEKTKAENVAEELAIALMESDEYKRYKVAEKKVKDMPGLYDQINHFRRTNLSAQRDQSSDLFTRMDAVEQEFMEFRENPLVKEFLASELAFCRLYQRVNYISLEKLEFDVDFLRD